MIAADSHPASTVHSTSTADQAFFDRYIDLVPSDLVLDLPTF